ncbi:MAG: terpene cyclase/mutase family protein [Anaerolineae bacterium]|jgi:hypothetical protein
MSHLRKLTSILFVFALMMTFADPASAQDPVETGLAYLSDQQQPDGGFTNGFSEGSDLGTTTDVILAIAAAEEDVTAYTSAEGNSPLDYLATQLSQGTIELLGSKAKVALTLSAVGQDPASFAGQDLLADLEATYDPATGSYGGSIFDQALVILALNSSGQAAPEAAVTYLVEHQADNGGWALFGEPEGDKADTNTTALVIQALVAAGHEEPIAAALDYYHQVQNDDGGFPYQNPSEYGTDTDANSTAYVLQALNAAGESLDDWAPAGTTPAQALEAMYDAESGGFLWQVAVPGANVLATAQAIPALEGYSFVSLPDAPVDYAPAEAEETAPETSLLPESGAVNLLPVAISLLGAALTGLGLFLRRRAR